MIEQQHINVQYLQHFIPSVEECIYVRRPLVLVIDNHPAIREMLSWALYRQGYQTVCLASGQDAARWLSQAQQRGIHPTVILLDAAAAETQGKLLIESLRSQWTTPAPFPPTILLTVARRDYDHLIYNSVLIKPFHLKDLYRHIKAALIQK